MRILHFAMGLVSMAGWAQSPVLWPDLSKAPAALSLFEPLATPLNERDFAISPDGKEVYFTISTPRSTFQTIVYCRNEANGWSAPEIVSFAGEYSDLEPAFSADGNTLYFASNRPVEGTALNDFDIWKVTRQQGRWGAPVNLGAPVNTDADEFYPSVTTSGNLYFTAAYTGGPGREDIYVSRLQNKQYQPPVPLDTAVNTKFYEFNAFVSPDERYVLFTSYGRKDDMGGGDLYISERDDTGRWKQAVHLRQLNSEHLDYCPYLSPDGKSLFFTSERHQLPTTFVGSKATYTRIQELRNTVSNGSGNIYWITFSTVLREHLR